MNKLDMESKDIVKDNLEYIKERFPEAVTEENGELRINPDSLIQSLSSVIIDDKKEKYELTWPGKRQSIVEGNTRTTKTLRPLKDKSVDFDKTENIYIEGDNLEALKILQESYLNRIKCIYIDPPYNTGNDFIYNDNFDRSTKEELIESGQIDELGNRLVTNNVSNGRFHSDWLSMMYPRLKLARNLLSKDGIIFISIDDNEVDNLRKMCDEIFGENNFQSCISWRRRSNQPNDATKMIAKVTEYILVYSKNEQYLRENKAFGTLEMNEDRLKNYTNPDNDPKGPWSTTPWCASKGQGGSRYKITTPNGIVYDEVWLGTEETFNKYLEEGRIYWTSNGDGKPRKKIYRSEAEQRGQAAIDFWVGDKYGDNLTATNDLKKLFGNDRIFDYSKPVKLLKNIIKLGCPNDGIVLDFFSGSGSFANACLELNSEDNNNRKFILIQISEKVSENSLAFESGYRTICDIGEERIRRAANKIKEETNADVDYGFRVYKIDESNMKDEFYLTPDKVTQEQIKLFEDNIKEDRTPDDLITQVILNLGLKLDLPIEEKNICGNKVFDVDDGKLLACFDDNVSIDIIEEIAKINPRQVVFRDSSFATDQDKVNFEERLKRLSAGTKFNVL